MAPPSVRPGSVDVQATADLSTLPDVQFAQSRATYPALMVMGAPLRLDEDEEDMDMNPRDAVVIEAEKEDQSEEVHIGETPQTA